MNELLKQIGIEKVFCINLKRRTDRRAHVEKVLIEIGLKDVEFVEAVDALQLGLKLDPALLETADMHSRLTPGMIGCYESHKRLLKKCIDDGLNSYMVLEDDIKPILGFNSFFSYAVKELPADWQMMYLGNAEHGDREPLEVINEYWVRPRCIWGTHCFAIKGQDVMKLIYKGLEQQVMQIDEQLTNFILPNSGIKVYNSSVFQLMWQMFEWKDSDVQKLENKEIKL